MISITELVKRDKEKIINPSLGEAEKVRNADDDLKTLLPYIASKIIGDIQMMILPAMTAPWTDEKKLFDSRTKNLKNNVWANNSPSPNAYTVPALKGKTSVQGLIASDYVGLGLPAALLWATFGLFKLANSPLTGRKLPGGKVAFNGQTEVQMWETRGLKSLIPEDDFRFAIQLHEVGHWVNYQPVFISLLSRVGGFLLPPLIVPFTIIAIYQGRVGEWRADAFAKQMGYGESAAKALSRFGYSRRENISVLGKIEDMLRVISTKIHNVIDDYLPITIHPSVKKRTRALLKDHLIVESYREMTYEEYINELYEMRVIEEGLKQFLVNGIRPLLAPVDRELSKLTPRLFPLSRK